MFSQDTLEGFLIRSARFHVPRDAIPICSSGAQAIGSGKGSREFRAVMNGHFQGPSATRPWVES